MLSPFLEPHHAELAARVRAFADHLAPIENREDDVDALCTSILARLGEAGFTRHSVPRAWGGESEALDVRALCVIRENLAYRMELADFAFAMQGLGSYPLALAGSDAQRHRLLPRV